MTKIEVPSKVERILCTLQEHGYEAYVVGGCVRDAILGRQPEDWDITTSASPEQVKQLFSRTVDTGIQHGTVTVLSGETKCEVTTYRIDGDYEDGRHPRQVTFTSSLEEDLKRRDFTINAMAYSEENGLVDLFGGVQDLTDGIIRCVGDPKERFSEDALRMLRAIRFAAQLGFSLSEDVRAAILDLSGTLEKISAERVQTEMVKLITSPHPEYFRIAYECGLTAVFLPEFDRIMQQRQNNPHHIYTAGEHTLIAMQNIAPDKILRLTMLLHDIGKPDVCWTDEQGIDHFHGHAAASEKRAGEILKRLKFDNETINTVRKLIRYHSRYPALTPAEVRKNVYEMGGPKFFELFLKVKRADVMAQHPDVKEEKLDYLDKLQRIWEQIRAEGDCLSLSDLAVTGEDLITEGHCPGPEIGRILHELLYEVLEVPGRNTKEYLLARSREI